MPDRGPYGKDLPGGGMLFGKPYQFQQTEPVEDGKSSAPTIEG